MSRALFNRSGKIIIAILVLAIFSAVSSVIANESSESKITFLQFRVDSSGFNLTKTTTVEGKLKTPRSETLNDYTYEILDIESAVLFKGSFENPLIQRIEYEDPENPGWLITKVVELPVTEITIRAPFYQNMHRLNIYQVISTATKGTVKTEYTLKATVSLEDVVAEVNK